MSTTVEEDGKHASGLEERHLQEENIDDALLLWMKELQSPPEYNKFQSAYFYAKNRLGDPYYVPTGFAATSKDERSNVAKYMKDYYLSLIERSQAPGEEKEDEEFPSQ